MWLYRIILQVKIVPTYHIGIVSHVNSWQVYKRYVYVIAVADFCLFDSFVFRITVIISEMISTGKTQIP